MTDSIIEGSDQVIEPANTVPSQQEQAPFNPDDYVHKSKVDDLIFKRTKEVAAKTAEKTRNELAQQNQQQQSRSSAGMGGMPTEDFERVAKQVFHNEAKALQEKSAQEAYERRMTDMATDFLGKLSSKPDLLKREEDIKGIAGLVPLLNTMEDVAGITEHLLDNPGALGSIYGLAHNATPELVRNALKKIELGIKTNNEALNRNYPNSPLSQPSPSVNAMDNGSGTAYSSLKSADWLRG